MAFENVEPIVTKNKVGDQTLLSVKPGIVAGGIEDRYIYLEPGTIKLLTGEDPVKGKVVEFRVSLDIDTLKPSTQKEILKQVEDESTDDEEIKKSTKKPKADKEAKE